MARGHVVAAPLFIEDETDTERRVYVDSEVAIYDCGLFLLYRWTNGTLTIEKQ